MFNGETIQRVAKITRINVNDLLTDLVNFNDNLKQDIVDYYSGELLSLNVGAFNELERLINAFETLSISMINNNISFDQFYDWELIDYIDTILNSLNTVFNSSKFQRSAISKNNFVGRPTINTVLKQNQTLEALSRDGGSTNEQQDWADIFLNNQLREEDYTPSGGTGLQVTFQGQDNLFINSVVDSINTSEKTYGIDIARKIDLASGDLAALSYSDTLDQAIEILISLARGNVPERPQDGFDPSLVVGSSRGAVSLPALFRQLYKNFARDDTFKSFKINNIEFISDALAISFEVQTRSGEIKESLLRL